MAPLLGRLGNGGGTTAGFGFGRRRAPSLLPFDATGGTKIPSASSGNGYTYHIFTGSSGTLSRDVGPTTVPLDILLVAGGGGGASGAPTGGGGGGGGGAGGLIEITSLSVDFSSPITITVGGGGSRSPDNYYVQAPSGTDSTFAPGTPQALTAKGGGGGAAYQYAGPNPPATRGGAPGGSGGGAGGTSAYPGGTATQPTQPGNSGTYGYGFAGNYGGDAAGGGGGAGGTGSIGNNTTGGAGGTGKPISWVPPSYGTPGPTPGRWFAGGGAGGSYTGGVIGGGAGGGGNGGNWNTGVAGQPGTTNTGGGGGGGNNAGTNGAGPGGPGICIIRYPGTYI